jgi:uncharacterized membrane protein YhaH (DUF805 family)
MDWFVLVLKKYAQFQGRSRRSEYWYFALFHVLIALAVIVPAIIFIAIGASSHNSIVTGLGVVLYLAYFAFSLALLVPSVAVTVRRLHDTGRSGWWYFIALVPFAGPIILLVFLCSDSQPGDNLYGPNPKGIGPWGLMNYPPPANLN